MNDSLKKVREATAAVADDWLAHRRVAGELQILDAVVLDERDKETRETVRVQDLQAFLLKGRRIVLEAPAGAGKTITLVQIARLCSSGSGLPFLIDLPYWVRSKLDLLEHIATGPRYRARGIDANSLAELSETEHFLFLLNGWNEVSDSEGADRVLSELGQDFPAAGVVVATRAHHTKPPLPGSLHVRLRPLSREQRSEYLKDALGDKGAELEAILIGDQALDELTSSPFILSEAAKIFRDGKVIPKTKMGIIGAATYLLEHADEHQSYLQGPPVLGRAQDYLVGLASRMTGRGDVDIGEEEARAICYSVSVGLHDVGQIAGTPDQVSILKTLGARHVLERGNQPSVSFRFAHQLYREFYAALQVKRALLDVAANENDEEKQRFAKTYVNEPSWDEPLRMVAEEIGAAANNSASVDKLNAGKLLVQVALRIDPFLAGTLARLCGCSVWKEIRTELSERLRSLYAAPNRHYRRCALAAVLATGSDEFADIIIPLLTDAYEQVRGATYRAGPDFHPSSLGPEWQTIVAGWAELYRIEFISELALHKGRSEVALTFARSDPSPTVRIEAVRALAWTGRSSEIAELLQALPDKDFQQALLKLDAEDIPPSLRSRAISNYKCMLGENTDLKTRFQIALDLAELGDEDTPTRLKDELTRLPAAIVNKLGDHSLRPAIEIIRNVDPQWVSQWVADRIIEGWSDAWLSMVAGIPKSLSEHLLHRICTEDLVRGDSGRIISLLAATADAALAKTIFGKLRDHRHTLMAEPLNEEKHAIDAQLRDLFKALAAPVAVEGLSNILAGEPADNELPIITERFGDIGAERDDLRSLLPDHLRQQLRQYFKRAVSGVLAQDDLGGQAKARLASSLAEVGEPDDVADLLRLIRADIERFRNGWASFQQGGRGTKAQGNITSHSIRHVQALVRLAHAQSESTLINLLREPEYEIDAAWGLREIAKTQPSKNPIVESRFGWPERDYRRVRNGPPEWSTTFDEGRRVRCAAAVTQRILELREESRSGDHKTVPYHRRLKELAKVLADSDPEQSADLIIEIAALPASRDGWLRAALLEGLLFGGAALPTESIGSIVDPVVKELRVHGIHSDDAGLLSRLLCVLAFVQPSADGFARIRELLTEFRLAPHRDLLMAFSQSECDEGLSDLRDFAQRNSAAFHHSAEDWIEAVAACPLAGAKFLLLGFIDPEVSDGFAR